MTHKEPWHWVGGDHRSPEEINAEIEAKRQQANGSDGVVAETETNGHDKGYETILHCMHSGLSDDEIREKLLTLWPDYPALDWDIKQARRHWEGESARMRVTARQTEMTPKPNAITDGNRLLDKAHKFLGRFVRYPNEHAHVAHTLWCAHTHAVNAFDSTPRIAFLSPEPASGKTRALEATEPLVPNPIEAVNVTAAYLFRKVAEIMPTILHDEIDTVFGPKARDNEEVRGLLNAGHRKGAVAGRCVVKGKTVTTEEIPAYCPVALAGLGVLPDTILTRSIVIPMQRRAPNEEVEQWRRRKHAKQGAAIRDELALWAESYIGDAVEVWPELPPEIKDRDADVWESLFVIADLAGGNWPERCKEAAIALTTAAKVKNPSLGVQLLADLREIFGDKDQMSTEDILSALHNKDDAPWAELRGKPLTNTGLSKLLKPYDIKSKTVRIGHRTPRGYTREALWDAWQRYLSPLTSPKGTTTPTDETEGEK